MVGSDGIVRIPYAARKYFQPYHDRTERYACIVAHRRAGKTVACINDLQRMAFKSTVAAIHAYIAPTYSQAKSVAFDYLLEAAGPAIEYGAKVNQSELRVTYPHNGATVRLFGADNYDALRGLRLAYAVLDEPADMDPRAWPAAIRPALSDLRGGATFIGTPRGHDWFYETIVKPAKDDPDWYLAILKASELVPLNDLIPNAKEKRYLTSDELADNRKRMTEDLYRQEYECDFEAAIIGAYFGKQMAEAANATPSRIGLVPYDPAFQVYTAWDIGGDRDATAIWFAQLIGKGVHLIDYYEAVGADSAPHAKAVLEKPYSYAQHFLPFDAGPNRIGIDKSYSDFLGGHGLRNITVLPAAIKEHGINLARLLLARCWFGLPACDRGVECLKMWHSKWDEKNKIMGANEVHDWSSHGAAAFRYLAQAIDKYIASSSFNRKLVYPNMKRAMG